jgi:hypothetical protein
MWWQGHLIEVAGTYLEELSDDPRKLRRHVSS